MIGTTAVGPQNTMLSLFLPLVAAAVAVTVAKEDWPNGMGCVSENARDLPYCDVTLSVEERLSDLSSRLSREELVSRLQSNGMVPSVDRVGLPEFNYRVEAVHGLEAFCIDGKGDWCPTYFPIAQGVAASFNRSVFENMGVVIGEEAKIWAQKHGLAKSSRPMGTSVRCPMINVIRDPRWGRADEAPSEDPYLTGVFGYYATLGVQRQGNAAAEAKHFAAYDLETNADYQTDGRKGFDAQVTAFDWTDSYVVPFEMTIRDAKASSYMCSYNAVNGTPSCANSKLSSLAKDDWGMPGFIESDCDAVGDLLDKYHLATTKEEASAIAIHARTDLDCGHTYKGLVDAEDVDDDTIRSAFHNAMRPLFLQGLFDPDTYALYSGDDEMAALLDDHRALALESSYQSLVLLKNDHDALPLNKDDTNDVALIGPLGFVREQLVGPITIGPCAATTENPGLLGGGYKEDYGCVPTLNETLQPAYWSPGAENITSTSDAFIDEAIAAAKKADVVVFALGAGLETVDETDDLRNLSLPGIQNDLVKRVVEATRGNDERRYVVVLVMGNQYAVDAFVQDVDAVLNAFIPSSTTASKVIVDALYGSPDVRFGKLPYTMYHDAYSAVVDIADMSFANRGYRYYDGDLVSFPFGFGLSYTTFHLGGATLDEGLLLRVKVSNVGDRDGDEVVQLYLRPVDVTTGAPLPLKKLIDFDRVSVDAGATETVTFTLTYPDSFALVDAGGSKAAFPGDYELIASNGIDDATVPVQLHDDDVVVVVKEKRAPPLSSRDDDVIAAATA